MPAFETPDPRLAIHDPRYTAAIELLRRNGAREMQIRFDDEQDPIVYVAVAGFSIINGKPSGRGKTNAHQAGGGLDPLAAMFALCRACLDRRGLCTHCGKNTMFNDRDSLPPLEDYYCWYQWNAEGKTFQRGCE